MKKHLAILLLLALGSGVFAQNITHYELTSGYCGNAYMLPAMGAYVQSASVNGTYPSGEDCYLTVCGTCTAPVRLSITFEHFDLAATDTLYIYDGGSTAAPMLYCGNNSFNAPNSLIVYATAANTEGCLTIRFVSHSSNGTGFLLLADCMFPCEVSSPAIDDVFYKVRNGNIVDTGRLRRYTEIDTTLNSDGTISFDTNVYRAANICLGEQIRLRASATYTHRHGVYTPSDATTKYRWSFGNGDSLVGLNQRTATISYNAINCYFVNLTLTDTMGCLSSTNEQVRVRLSSNPIRTITPLSVLCGNDTLRLNVGYSPNSQITLHSIFSESGSQSNSVKTFIPDGPNCEVQCYSAPVTFTDFPNGRTVQSAGDICSICVNYEHSFMGDYKLSIICPTGRTAVLKYKDAASGIPEGGYGGAETFTGYPYGGTEHDVYDGGDGQYCDSVYNMFGVGLDYCFSRNSGYQLVPPSLNGGNSYFGNENGYVDCVTYTFPPIPAGYARAGSAPPEPCTFNTRHPSNKATKSDYYLPADDLSQLVGCPLNGTWQIQLCDYWGIDNGWVFNWSLDICNIVYNTECRYQVGIDSILWQLDPSVISTNGRPGINITTHDSTAVITVRDTSGVFSLNAIILDEFGCQWDTSITFIAHPGISDTTVATACDSYVWQGTTYYSSTFASRRYQTSYGCDSSYFLRLQLQYSTSTADTQLYCDSFYWDATGKTYTESTIDTFFTQTTLGCDSTVILHLGIVSPHDSTFSDTLCAGSEYSFAGRTLTLGGFYCDTIHSMVAPYCDSVVTLYLTELYPPYLNVTDMYSCRPPQRMLHVSTSVEYVNWSSSPRDTSLIGQEHNRDIIVRPNETTTYTVLVDYNDRNTCPSTATLTFDPVHPPVATIEANPRNLTEERLSFVANDISPYGEERYWFLDGEYWSDQIHIRHTVDRETDSVQLRLDVYNRQCADTAYLTLHMLRDRLFTPNVFTPGQNVNNRFYVKCHDIDRYEITIYTRQGAKVYSSTDMDEGWDGTSSGSPCPQGVYTYIIDYATKADPRNPVQKRGTVLLLR
jgi:gliding motility-associated-like protein